MVLGTPTLAGPIVLRAPWRISRADGGTIVGAATGSLAVKGTVDDLARWLDGATRRTDEDATRALCRIGALAFSSHEVDVAVQLAIAPGARLLVPPSHVSCERCLDAYRVELAQSRGDLVPSLQLAFAAVRVAEPTWLIEDDQCLRLLPAGRHPRCERCGGVESRLAGLVDLRRGPVRGITNAGSSLSMLAFGVVDNDDGSSCLTSARATGDSLRATFEKSVAETVERVACLSARPHIFDRSTSDLPAQDYIAPERMGLFTGTQYALGTAGFPAHDAEMPLPWQVAEGLGDVRQRLVLHDTGHRASPLYRGTTNGWAAHVDRDRAILGGLLELIGRDAVLTSWYRSLRGATEIVVPDAWIHDDIAVRLFDVRQDIDVPVVLATATSTGGGLIEEGAIFVASAARCTLVEAVGAALSELRQALPRAAGVSGASPQADALHGPADHLAYFLHPPNARPLRGWLSQARSSVRLRRSTRGRPVIPSARGHVWVQRRLAMRGYEPLVVDGTTAEARLAGLTIVRAVIPDLMPLGWGPPRSLRIGNLARRLVRAGAEGVCTAPLTHEPHPID